MQVFLNKNYIYNMEEVGLKFTRTFHITMKKIKVKYRQKLEELKDFLSKTHMYYCI